MGILLGMSFGNGVLTAITGILLVFLVLCVLVAVVVGIVKIESLLSVLVEKKKAAALPAGEEREALTGIEKPVLPASESPLLISNFSDDGKIAAVIAAAVAVMTENLPEVKSGKSRFIVRDIRRI
jgi:Na+-transporting methylmalonyl-CoA/oxaloacetate decarboxylase gamma subunit